MATTIGTLILVTGGAEAAAHIEQYGRVGSVVTIREQALAGLVEEIRFETEVTPPFGADHVVAVSADSPLDGLNTRLM